MNIKVNKDVVVVFDLDDTLYSELDYLISAYKEIALLLGASNEKYFFAVLFSLYRNNENVFDFIVKQYDVNKEYLLKLYRNHIPRIKPKKKAVKILKSIKSNGGKIGLITDGRSITQRNKLKALRIEKYFDLLIISSEIGESKPSSKAFLKVMNELPAKEYFYIADNFKKDFIAPNKLNWQTIGIIDSGKNIHSNAYENQEREQLPRHLLYKLKEIKINNG